MTERRILRIEELNGLIQSQPTALTLLLAGVLANRVPSILVD